MDDTCLIVVGFSFFDEEWKLPLQNLAFDLAHYLLLWQDPSVKELAEQIAKDPSFTNFAQQLQQVRQDGSVAQQVDYQKYMSAFQQVMQNPQFVTMAKKLGSAVMQVDPGGNVDVDSHHPSINHL